MEDALSGVEETKVKVKSLPTPDEQKCSDELSVLKQTAGLRNSVIYAQRRLVRMVSKDNLDKLAGINAPDDLARLSVPHSVVNETARIIGRQMPLIEVVSEGVGEKFEREAAEAEEFIRWVDLQLENAYSRAGGQDALRIARAKYLVQDGRLVSILNLRPESPEFPFRYRLVDPTEMFFVYDDEGIAKAYRATTLTAEQIRSEWGPDVLDTQVAFDETFEVIGYWDREWYAVWLDRKASDRSPIKLKRPVKHGYSRVPVIVTHVGGWLGALESSAGHATDMIEAYRGVGAFWPHAPEYMEYLRVISAQIYDTIYNARPSRKIMLPPGNMAFDADVEDGDDITIPAGGDVNFLYKQGGLPHAKNTGELLSNMIQGGTLPVGQGEFASGIERMMATQHGQSFFIPFVEGLKAHYRELYTHIIELYRDYGVPLNITTTGPSGRTVKRGFSPLNVPDEPTIIVEFGDLAPVDVWQALNAATPAMASGILDEYSFWHDIVRHPKARSITDRARSARALRQQPVSEQLVEIDAIEELFKRAEEYRAKGSDDLAELAEMKAKILQATLKQQLQQALNPQQTNAPQSDIIGGPDESEMPPEMLAQLLGGAPPQGPMEGPPPEFAQMLGGATQGPPQMPIPGLPGGNGSNGLPGQPFVQGARPEYSPPGVQSGGLDMMDPGMLQAILSRAGA